ncbi:uncharacterized protein LOC127804434 [Diospyros lotus]|uniref:uncharacterized protein LOC127804434 n=1 Tax=Diospyros lotus TaxID=55363 RepID=UPI00224D3DAF|nr:uncharacterized protein LOC127804434 [Diospyros lotus]
MAQQEEQKKLRKYAMPKVDGISSSIQRPIVQANNFEIKPSIIQMIQTSVQFGGFPNDDPNQHLGNFLEICDTFRFNRVSDDAVRLRIFPFSLQDKAKSWLSSLLQGSITTRADLAQKFLAKFFPPAKTTKMRNDITSFMQQDSETLYEAWERYKELLRRCPHHGIPDWLQVQTFYNGLLGHTRAIIDATTGGALMDKSFDYAYTLLEDMAANNYQWNPNRTPQRRTAGVYEIDAIFALTAQVHGLTKQLAQSGIHTPQETVASCDLCEGNHLRERCGLNTELAQYVGNYTRKYNNPNSNFYNPSWRNHPNLS